MEKNIENIPAISMEMVEKTILIIRGQKVMLDSDLARLYGVSVKHFNERVRRNIKRFPQDFMFQMTETEFSNLRSQFATAKYSKHRYLPYVFTEYGVAMLSSVLKSERAILVNIEIMRAFGRLRRILATHRDLLERLNDLEKNYDEKFSIVFDAIKKLMEEPAPEPEKPIERPRMGFIDNP